MKILQALLLWTCTRMIIGSINKMEDIQIKEIHQSGLYFERLRNIKFAQNHAKLVIFIDFSSYKDNITIFENIFASIHDACNLPENKCLPYNIQIKKLKHEFEEVYSYFDMTAKSYKNLDATLSENMLMKYNVEAELFDRNGNDDVILNLNNEAIMLESTLSRISSMRRKENEKIFGYLNNIQSMVVDHLNYIGTLEYSISLMKEELQHVKRSGRLLMDNINAIKENKLLSTLLDNYNWEKAIRYIEDFYFPNKFPGASKAMKLESLSGLIYFKYGVWKNKIFIEANIPLINNLTSTLYEIKALPTPQRMYQDLFGIAFIKSESRYMLIQNQDYYNMQEEEFQLCKNIEDYILCPKQWFIFNTISNCEHSLLSNPTKLDFRTCNIQYKNLRETNFIKIDTIKNWLFITPNPINITINCVGNKETIIEINNTGLLGSNNHCILKYGDNQIRINTPVRITREKVIFPDINLNLAEITTIFNDIKTTMIFKELTNRETEYSFWELERICKDLSTQQDEYSNLVVSVIVLFIIVILVLSIVIGIITFMYYFKKVLQETPDEIEIGIREEIELNPARGLTTRAVLRFV